MTPLGQQAAPGFGQHPPEPPSTVTSCVCKEEYPILSTNPRPPLPPDSELRKQRKQCENILSDFQNRLSQISGRRPPLTPPLAQRANFRPFRPFRAFSQSQKQSGCENNAETTKTMRQYSLRFSTKFSCEKKRIFASKKHHDHG